MIEQPLVKAKRLVFVQKRHYETTTGVWITVWECHNKFCWYMITRYQCDEGVAYRDIPEGGYSFKWSVNHSLLAPPTGIAESFDDCVAGCQADFDARWLSITEVPELQWQEDSDGSVSCVHAGEQYGASFVDGVLPVIGVVAYHGIARWKTMNDFTISANTHNRRMVLGEQVKAEVPRAE